MSLAIPRPLRRTLRVAALVFALTVAGVPAVRAEQAERYRELEIFTDVLAIIRDNYVEEVPLEELIHGAIDGMISRLDPHSAFLPPDDFSERKVDTRGQFGGLGIEITLRGGLLTVVAPLEDTPAARAGLQANDQILRINEQFTKDLSINDAIKQMRGEPGTSVTLTILREGFESPRDFTLVREIIQIRSVKSQMLEEGYGYVRVSQFQERTTDDLKAALTALTTQNGSELRGLILDLRNNPGGLLDQAVRMADLFLKEGLIVYTEGRQEESFMRFTANRDGDEPEYPLLVLINAGSASASEIVAGALQDQGRALILGVRSFGKGSVQTLVPLGNEAGLSLTTARYFTPNGTSIQATGIEPDIVMPQASIQEAGGGQLREADLAHHFENGAPAGASGKSGPPRFAPNEEMRKDYQLMRALDLLKGVDLYQTLKSAPRPPQLAPPVPRAHAPR